jgi:hypothetical protein
MRVLAVDVGGRTFPVVPYTMANYSKYLALKPISRESLANLLPTLSEGLRQLRSKHANSFEGIGFGFCGLVDSAAGRVVSTNHE